MTSLTNGVVTSERRIVSGWKVGEMQISLVTRSFPAQSFYPLLFLYGTHGRVMHVNASSTEQNTIRQLHFCQYKSVIREDIGILNVSKVEHRLLT
ncbi:hypothetical protein AVEN_178634-1 [Araneus ventricosus]|uniref:Uncharacterized protein n=1 Tax=Araneus ventricosus TaxID=182803 RepID=A0A4Y2UDE0_ARAVE|nr:hypothetical protein AVEN_178634-1 [Araneus ventricosus]